jgi:pimeloyl-ACP methyl ester carboxylesterase
MPIVFVHGVPDTKRVWQPVMDRLARKDAIALSLPGFAAPVPPGFSPTKDGYAAWLLDALRQIGGPIDLVGHDWGSMLVVRAVSLEPAIVRSWAGGGAPIDPDYVWHETAKAWQTPNLGEQVMAQMTPPLIAKNLEAQGQPAAIAAEAAAAMTDAMKSCILSLYRSAVNVGNEWVDDLARIAAPGLILWGENDPYSRPEFGARLASRTRAAFAQIDRCGHWYQAERPDETVEHLQKFWARVAG